MINEQNNVERIENDQEEPTIKSAEVHIGTTIESAQNEGVSPVEAIELPLRLLVLGDFTLDAPPPSDWAEVSPPIRVDKNNFQSVMQQLNPNLSLDVPNRLSNSPKELTVDLSFPDMKAFRPEGIARQVDVLASLLEVRGLVNQVKNRELTLQEFEERLQQTGMAPAWLEQFHQLLRAKGEHKAPPLHARPAESEQPTAPQPERPPESLPDRTSKPKGDALDSLLDMVDLGDEQAIPKMPGKRPSEPGPVDSLIRAIVQPQKGGPRADRSIAEAVIDEIDGALSGQINDILHHSKFQQLESTWRGLKFLIDRIDFRKNIQVELLSVPKSNLRDAIYHQVFQPEYNDLSEYPLSVMIADYEFDRSPEDMELLGDIARMAASMQVPFIASVGPEFFGLQTAEEQVRLPSLRAYFQKPEYAQWRSLRDNETSQYIALTLPRFLLRFPYGPDGEPVREFQFTENTDSSSNHLWGRGSFAVATTIAHSFIENGWCTRITGLSGGGVVENLPLWKSRAAGRDVRIPLDVLFPQSKELEFADAGFALLSCRINDDAACVLYAPTVYRTKKYSTPEETKESQLHATLPYQLFATRMAHYLRRIVRDDATGLTAEQAQEMLTAKFRGILAKTDGELSEEAVTVEVEESEEKPEYYDVFLRVRSPFQILGRGVDLLLGFELHR
jgi:type VI secretion system protein ImpC